MGIPVLIIGESGSGKSTSLRNFSKDEIGLINVSGKPLPFRSDIQPINTDSYNTIVRALTRANKKIYIIDDAQYLMVNEFMRSAKITGYQKFTDIALNFWELVQEAKKMPDDRIIYFLGHVERDNNGNEKFKTIGKMLDEKITVEGMFTIVLKTQVNNGKYQFATQTNGQDTVKSPMGMFEEPAIDNDLKFVDTTIREYYGLNRKDDTNEKD